MIKPFSRIGGKHFLKKDIITFFPENYVEFNYIEPFAGGASLYFHKEKSIGFEVLNDIDEKIKTLLKGFKKYNPTEITSALREIPKDKETFNQIKSMDILRLSKFQIFINLVYLSKNSYFGNLRSFIKSKTNYVFNDYRERMKDTLILKQDYRKIFEKYDSTNSLFYIDPPYEKSKWLYDNISVDYNELAEILKNLKGKFLLSLNYNPKFFEIFKFNYVVLKIKYQNIRYINRVKKEYSEELLFFN